MLPIEDILAREAPVPPGHTLGRSREGRNITGFVIGKGGTHVSLIGGCHSDEPVGPAMLRKLVSYLSALPSDAPLLTGFTWYVVPHVNPDGEARNAAWSDVTLPTKDHLGREDRAYDLALYLRHVLALGASGDAITARGYAPISKRRFSVWKSCSTRAVS